MMHFIFGPTISSSTDGVSNHPLVSQTRLRNACFSCIN